MLRQKVESSVIYAIGYDADLQILEVEFVSGKVYAYYEISKTFVSEFLSAESKGSFYNENIRGQYESYKMS